MKKPYKHRPLYPKRHMALEVLILVLTLIAALCVTTAQGQSLAISQDALDELKIHFDSYQDSLGVEFAFCANGVIRGDTTYILDIDIPPQFHQRNNAMAFFKYCKGPIVAWGHSHPPGYPNPSSLDLKVGLKMEMDTILLYKEKGELKLKWFRLSEILALYLRR